MRIEPNRTSPELETDKTAQPTKIISGQQTAAASVEDTTSLADTVNVKTLLTQALSTPELRQDKVELLRQALASGQYQIDAESIASAMLS